MSYLMEFAMKNLIIAVIIIVMVVLNVMMAMFCKIINAIFKI